MVRLTFDEMRLEIRWGKVFLINTDERTEELIDISTLCTAEEKYLCEKLEKYSKSKYFKFAFGDYTIEKAKDADLYCVTVKGEDYFANRFAVEYSEDDKALF